MKLPIMAPMQECPKCIALRALCPQHAQLEEKKNDRYYKKCLKTINTVKTNTREFNTFKDLDAAVEAGELKVSHTSRRRGYVSRKTDGYFTPYKGKFGQGFTKFTPCFDSSQYCFVTYYLEIP